jgi:hypothetical protein
VAAHGEWIFRWCAPDVCRRIVEPFSLPERRNLTGAVFSGAATIGRQSKPVTQFRGSADVLGAAASTGTWEVSPGLHLQVVRAEVAPRVWLSRRVSFVGTEYLVTRLAMKVYWRILWLDSRLYTERSQ